MSSSTVINTNVRALNSHRNLTGVGGKQDKASKRLSSGKKINSAADDAAGLAISTKMKAQIRGLDMAYKNSQDATSLIQTAEGSLSEINNMVQRIRELTVQASTDTNTGGTASDRSKMADEIDQLLEEITNMAGRTEFNTKVLATGKYTLGSNLIKYSDGSKITAATGVKNVNVEDFTLYAADGSESGYVKGGKAVSFDNGDNYYIKKITNTGDETIEKISAANLYKLVDSDTTKNTELKDKLTVSVLSADDLKTSKQGVLYFETSKGQKYALKNDLALADAAADLTDEAMKTAIIDKSALTFQIGANNKSDDASKTRQSITLNISSVTADELFQKVTKEGVKNAQAVISDVVRSENSTADDIAAVLDAIDAGLDVVTSQVSKLGAVQNRLEYTANNLQVSSENLSQANSRIEDADMAKEMTNLTAANVINQAAVSMLAQANQAPQNILQLLG